MTHTLKDHPRFYNKNGTPTAYSFACGSVQRLEKNGRWKEMYMEHMHYHVRFGLLNSKWELWETFSNDELTKARKLYNSIKLS